MQVTWKTVQHGLVSHPFENKDTIFRVEVVSDLAYDFCYCVEISVNQILTKYGHLVQWHLDFILGGFQRTVHCHHPKKQGTWCSDNTMVYFGSLKRPSIIKTHQNISPWCSDTRIIIYGDFKN